MDPDPDPDWPPSGSTGSGSVKNEYGSETLDPGSRAKKILDLGAGSAPKNLSILKLFLSSRKYEPGCLFIPDPDPDFVPIPDPGVEKAPDPGSAIVI